jgi:hypothetical protein
MKSTTDYIKAGIAETEKELTELDKRRTALVTRIQEMKHDILLLGGAEIPAAHAPKKPKEKGDCKDKGEQVGTVKTEWGVFPIFKNVRVMLLSEITGKVPAGEWFGPRKVRSALSAFYPASTLDKYMRLYLQFLEQLKFIEHNKKKGSGSKYKWTPRFQDKPMSEEEVKRRVEEDRKALQDVLG